MREKGDKQGIVYNAVFSRLALVRVHQIGDLCEGKKADAQGPHNLQQANVGAGQGVDIADKEVGIFVIAQQQQVKSHP